MLQYNNTVFLLKVFLTKHYRNRRLDDPDFVLDFEEIYVIDSKTKSITRAKVLVSINSTLNYVLTPLFFTSKSILLHEIHQCLGLHSHLNTLFLQNTNEALNHTSTSGCNSPLVHICSKRVV